LDTVTQAWNFAPYKQDSALSLNGKFKTLRAAVKKWSRNLSNLTKIINNCNFTLAMMDGLKEQRPLSVMEKNFKRILKKHTEKLLEAKRTYWKS
jgi:hypothetical protein